MRGDRSLINGACIQVGPDRPVPGSFDERHKLLMQQEALERRAESFNRRNSGYPLSVSFSACAIGGTVVLALCYAAWSNLDSSCGGDQRTGYFVQTNGGDIREVGANYFTTDHSKGICSVNIRGEERVLTFNPALPEKFKFQPK